MDTIKHLIKKSKQASEIMKTLDPAVMNAILNDMADSLIDHQDIILKLNKQDVKNGNAMLLSPMAMDRLDLNVDRINELTRSIRKLATLTGPLEIKNDYHEAIAHPSIIAVIYESRPHITAEASCMGFRSGNAVILRGGKEAFHTNTAIASILCDVLEQNGLPRELITLIPTTDRVSMTELIGLNDLINYVVPHGSEGLVHYIYKNSQVPVLSHIPELKSL